MIAVLSAAHCSALVLRSEVVALEVSEYPDQPRQSAISLQSETALQCAASVVVSGIYSRSTFASKSSCSSLHSCR